MLHGEGLGVARGAELTDLAWLHLLLQPPFPPGLSGDSAPGDKGGRGEGDTGHFGTGVQPTHRGCPAPPPTHLGCSRGCELCPAVPKPAWLSGGGDLSSLFLPAVFTANDLSIHLLGGDKSLRASLPLFSFSSLSRRAAGFGGRTEEELGIPFLVAERTEPWGRRSSPHPAGARIHPSDGRGALPVWVPERPPSRD